jgi:diguanylate cyclase (GGDEF)-like protein
MALDMAAGTAVAGLLGQTELSRARRLISVCLVALAVAACVLVFTVLQIRWWIDTVSMDAERTDVARLAAVLAGADPGATGVQLAGRITLALDLDGGHVAMEPATERGVMSVHMPTEPTAYFVWTPRPLGTQAMERFAPTRLPFILCAIGAVAFLLIRFHRLAGALDHERRHAQEIARTDRLTGIGNRLAFGEDLSARLASGAPFALATIDLDRFKAVNDQHGHAAGDAVLKGVARRLRRLAVGTDRVFRLGGDEFALLLDRTDREIERLARIMVTSLDDTYSIGGSLRVPIGASMGVVRVPEDGADPDRLMARVDRALYAAKAAESSVCVFFADLDKSPPLAS